MLRNGSTSANTETYLGFDAGHSSKAQWNIGVKKTGALQGDFIFNTRTGSSTSAERVRITNDGNVGIGSAIPAAKLDVVGGIKADGTIRIDNTASPTFYLTSTSTTGSSRIFFGDPDSDLVGRLSYVHNGDYFTFYAGYGERFRIAGNGDITVTSIDNFATGPTLKLFHNSGSPAANDVVSRISMFGDDSAGNETEYGRIETKLDNVTDGQETAHINFATRGLGSYANVFRIKRRSTGSAPSYTADDADGVILDVYNTGNPYPRYMNFIAKSAGNTDSNIGFWTEAVGGSPTEKFRIDSSGDYLFLGGTLRIKNSANNAQYGAIYGDSTSFHVNAGANLKLYSGGGERFVFDNNGNIAHTSAGSGFSYFKGSSEYTFGSQYSSPPAGGVEADFQIHTGKSRAAFSINSYYNNAGTGYMQFVSSRSNTKGVLGTKSQSGDYLADIRFMGDNGTNYQSLVQSAQILVRQKSTISDGDTSCTGELTIYVGSSASPPVVEEKVRIDGSGGITLRNTGCHRGLIFVHDGDGGDSCTSMANVQGSGGRGIVETKIYGIAANTTTDLAKSHWGGLALIGWSGTGHQGTEQVSFGYHRTPTSQYKAVWVGNLTVTYTMSHYTLRISHNASNDLNFWCILIGV